MLSFFIITITMIVIIIMENEFGAFGCGMGMGVGTGMGRGSVRMQVSTYVCVALLVGGRDLEARPGGGGQVAYQSVMGERKASKQQRRTEHLKRLKDASTWCNRRCLG